MFNTMFKTFVGPLEDEGGRGVTGALEMAQGCSRTSPTCSIPPERRLPFGIAQQGKCFRNEITTSNFTFRSCEFEIMEFEYFVKPGTDEKWWSHRVDERFKWYVKLGIKKENLDLHAHPKEKRAHYARACSDIIYKFPDGLLAAGRHRLPDGL